MGWRGVRFELPKLHTNLVHTTLALCDTLQKIIMSSNESGSLWFIGCFGGGFLGIVTGVLFGTVKGMLGDGNFIESGFNYGVLFGLYGGISLGILSVIVTLVLKLISNWNPPTKY